MPIPIRQFILHSPLNIFDLSWILWLDCKPFHKFLCSKASFTVKNKNSIEIIFDVRAGSEGLPFPQTGAVLSVHTLGIHEQITADAIKQKK